MSLIEDRSFWMYALLQFQGYELGIYEDWLEVNSHALHLNLQ